MLNVEAIRQQFPILKQTMHGQPLIYFDTAATAQKPLQVIEGMNQFYKNHYGTVHRAIYDLAVLATKEYQNTRVKAQKFLHAASPDEIIYTRGTTESINLVAFSFGKAFIKPGDEIIISEMEHHSNIVPWQMLCEERGAVLKVIPMDDHGILDMQAYKKMLSPKTKLVAITHISNALGTVNPVKEIITEAHKVGAKVLVDGSQAAPHIPIDVQDLDADFYVFSGHKVYGPTGIGILYGKMDLLNAMPPYQGGGDMIDQVTFEKTTYNTVPLKFEAGTPMIAEVIGLGAAFDFLNDLGLENIHQHDQELLKYATEKMQRIPGLKIIGTAPEKGAVISFVVDGVHPLDLGTMLDLKGVAIRTGHVCAQPTMQHFKLPAIARISFGVYNTKEEVDAFIAHLENVVRKLK